MPANLELDALKRLIKSGEIDTVLICMVDMQGRLMGKRYTGHFFLESGVKEAHTCDYLLAIDMEIEPVPGYKASSWARGYRSEEHTSELQSHSDLVCRLLL